MKSVVEIRRAAHGLHLFLFFSSGAIGGNIGKNVNMVGSGRGMRVFINGGGGRREEGGGGGLCR